MPASRRWARPGWFSDAVPGAGDAVAVAFRPRPARISAPKFPTRNALLHRHALGEVARLIDGAAAKDGYVVGQQLQGDDVPWDLLP